MSNWVKIEWVEKNKETNAVDAGFVFCGRHCFATIALDDAQRGAFWVCLSERRNLAQRKLELQGREASEAEIIRLIEKVAILGSEHPPSNGNLSDLFERAIEAWA